MTSSALVRRRDLLTQLGYEPLASRSSWSHDLGESIVFDAWEHQWDRDTHGEITKYPLRTNGQHYSLAEAQRNPRPGHTRWQMHVDLVLSGKRKARAILPVPQDPDSPSRGAKGWRPLVVEGRVDTDDAGQVWFYAVQLVSTADDALSVPTLPEEIISPGNLVEGARTTITINAYERSPTARKRCIERWGLACVACGLDFGLKFGALGEGFIHVHHLVPLSSIGSEYKLNPEQDLRPVCPNCHAMLHRQTPPLTIEQLAAILARMRPNLSPKRTR